MMCRLRAGFHRRIRCHFVGFVEEPHFNRPRNSRFRRGWVIGPSTSASERASNALLRRAFAGFQFGYLVSYTTGVPFNVVADSDLNSDTNNNDRPIGIARSSARQIQMGVRWSF